MEILYIYNYFYLWAMLLLLFHWIFLFCVFLEHNIKAFSLDCNECMNISASVLCAMLFDWKKQFFELFTLQTRTCKENPFHSNIQRGLQHVCLCNNLLLVIKVKWNCERLIWFCLCKMFTLLSLYCYSVL